MTSPWRLILDGPVDGAGNMARDEALLGSAERGAPPALRLYGWTRPALSLGAHQSAADADRDECRRLGVELVRRPTGGGAVLHHREVTYSVTGRLGDGAFPRSVVGVYEAIAEALVGGMARLGVTTESSRTAAAGRAPASCFGAPSSRELIADGRKLAGSAQLRRRGAFLQHGSILLDYDADLIGAVLPASRALPPPATLTALAGREVAPPEVETALVAAFAAAFGASLVPSRSEPIESEEAARLRAFKYLDAEWTLHGRLRSPVA